MSYIASKKKMYKIHRDKIISGKVIFKLHETHGFPIEMSAILAREKGIVIDWTEFYQCAQKAGWKTVNLVAKIKSACRDAGYNQEFMKEIEEEE